MTIDQLLEYVATPPELAATEFSGESERREYNAAGRPVLPCPSPNRFSGVLQTKGGIRYRVDYERYFSQHEDDGLREQSLLIADDGISSLYFPRAYGTPGAPDPCPCAVFSPTGEGFGPVYFRPYDIGFEMHPRFFELPYSTSVHALLAEYREYGDFYTITEHESKVVFQTTLDEPDFPRYTLIFDPARSWLVEKCTSQLKGSRGEETLEVQLVSTFEVSPGIWLPRETRSSSLLAEGGSVETRAILFEVKSDVPVTEYTFIPEIEPGVPVCDKRR